MSAIEPSSVAGRRLLLGVTGGIAAYKVAQLARLLVSAGADVRVVMTDAATRFVGPDTFAALTRNPVHTSIWDEPGTVLHVRLAHEVEAAVVAPATANVLSKLARGLADDLLTAILLESRCPLVVAPAMHTGMWEHPATQESIETLLSRGVTIVGPVAGPLAAGDEGVGRMVEPDEILAAVERVVARGRDLEGRRIVVTAGPTHEPIDAVRFVGNRSSGRMGIAIAGEAKARGADVTLVLGPGTAIPPPAVHIVRVQTADEMREAVVREVHAADALVMAAAVADFRPDHAAVGKLKKESGVPEIRLVATPDILKEIGDDKGDRVLIGFAAETGDLDRAGRMKLESKNLDLVVVNEVGREGTGFDSATNDAMILSREGDDEPLRSWRKAELASAICDRLVKLLGG